MIKTLEIPTPANLAGFDDIIDVRSPGEFAEDHIPGAINLPVLSDEERAEVGTIYVQDSKFSARRLGAAYVSENIARHLRAALQDKPGSYAPLIYCWRGGQRSQAMATILSQIGWRSTLLKGGYKTYRREVIKALYDAEPDFKMILLDGNTGTAKTELLLRLAENNAQIVDLEGLACHRGSLFGNMADEAQPSQRMFESRLLAELAGFDQRRPIIVEAESSKVGNLLVPPTVWKAMLAAPRIELVAPLAERATYLVMAYQDIVGDKARLVDVLARLTELRGRKQVELWQSLAQAGEFKTLAAELMERHYDPAYARSRQRKDWTSLGTIELEHLDTVGLDFAMDEIIKLVVS